MGKNTKRVPQVLIGDGVNSAATTLQTIEKGDLFLIKGSALINTDAKAAALTKNDTVQIVSCFENGKAILSMPIKGVDVNTYLGNKYDAPVEQVAYVGFDGVTGSGTSLPTTADEEFRLRVVFKGAKVLSPRGPWFFDSYASTGSTSVTQETIAGKLVDDFYANSVGANPYVIAERVSDAAKTVLGTATTSFDFVKGSNVVVCNGNIDDVTGGGAKLIVGAYIVIGAGATADTNAVYKIASINDAADTMTLDTPYVGTSATIVDTLLTQISAAAIVTAPGFGIKLTGLPIEPLLEDYDRYSVTRFEATFAQMGKESALDAAATITYATNPFAGNGYYRQVRAAEREAQTFAGWHAKTDYWHKKPVSLVSDTVGYDSITIEYENMIPGDFGRPMPAPQRATVYIPTGLAQSDEDTGDSFAAIMNSYFNGVLGFTALNLDV